MPTPHVLKPLRFIKSRIPALTTKTDPKLIHQHYVATKRYERAQQLAKYGNGAAVSAMAREVLAQEAA